MKKSLAELEKTLAVYFIDKAPPLPKSIKDLLVKIMPFLLIIELVILALGFLSAISMSLGAPWMMMTVVYAPHMGLNLLVEEVTILISLVMVGMAYSPISKRKYRGWQLLYYLTLVYLAEQLILLDLVGFIISGLVGFYFLFQIKDYYK